jgi:hypothetical protein
MEDRLENLRTTFKRLGLPQKKEFIDRLYVQQKTHQNPQYYVFLNECIHMYNQEARNAAPKKPPSRASVLAAEARENVEKKRAERQRRNFKLQSIPKKFIFCAGCGTRLDAAAKTCTSCGIIPYGARPTDEPQYPEFTVFTAAPFVNKDENSFTNRLHKHGRSPLFLAGTLLFTTGSIAGVLLSFGLISIFMLALLALPIIGLFMLRAASVKPSFPEKSLTSFTLFNVTAIIELVLICIGAAAAAIGFFAVGALGTAVLGNSAGGMVFVVFIFAAVIFAAFIYFYYVSLFRILAGMRNGVMRNIIKPLRSLTPFLIVSYILIASNVIGALIALVGANAASAMLNQLMPFSSVSPVGTAIQLLSLLAVITANTGMICLLVTLSNFNNSLKKI